MVFSAYIFSMIYENMSGYLRGFGISLIPAILTIIGVCVVRVIWIYTIFPLHRITALLIFITLIIYKPSKKLIKK